MCLPGQSSTNESLRKIVDYRSVLRFYTISNGVRPAKCNAKHGIAFRVRLRAPIYGNRRIIDVPRIGRRVFRCSTHV